jgi:hypothetical protein
MKEKIERDIKATYIWLAIQNSKLLNIDEFYKVMESLGYYKPKSAEVMRD